MISTTLLLISVMAGLDPAAEEKHLGTPRFTIPFRITPERKPHVKEVLLYVSRDRGRSWSVQARGNPQQEGFPFQASQDGSHWFSVALVDLNNRQEPFNIYTAPVGQKVYVDTARPEVKLWANRHGHDIAIQWEIREDAPNLNTLRLECRAQDMPPEQWLPIQVRAGLTGSGNFPAPSASPVQVRLHVSDVAGNQATVLAETAGTVGFGPAPSTLAAGSAANPSYGAGSAASPTYAPSYAQGQSTAQYGPAPGAATSSIANSNQGPLNQGPFNQGQLNQSQMAPGGFSQGAINAPTPGNAFDNAPIHQAGLAPANASGIRPSGNDLSTAAARPSQKPIQIVNQRQATVEIELGKVGPSGIGSVEVWTTLDDGENWSLASTENIGGDSPIDSPLVKPGTTRYKVPVQLQREGVAQGFTLIAKSRAGLGRTVPVRGEHPQLRLECDSTAPEATLFGPIPDPEVRNQLLLTWKASDKNLSTQPITLEWAEQPNGPWLKIGGGELPNTGRHSWIVPQGTPHSVFLRISARDLAGNKAVAQTQQPIMVDLSVPEVSILGVTQVR